MALTSPRFAGNARLQTASQNDPAMNWGEVGLAVQIVQQALADLGFKAAKTAGLDGIFGDETKANVSTFQRRNGLTADGVVGQATLTKLNQLLPRAGATLPPLAANSLLKFRFRIVFRSGALPTIPEITALGNARKVYGQYGFRVDEGPGMSILIGADQQVQLDASRTECTVNKVDGLQNLLFSLGGGRQGVDSRDILVFYINKLTDTGNQQLNGCASHRAGEPAVAASARGSPWTVAHEVGHVLLGNLTPTHSSSNKNLMFFSTNLITAAIPGLSEVQVRQMRTSPLCSRI